MDIFFGAPNDFSNRFPVIKIYRIHTQWGILILIRYDTQSMPKTIRIYAGGRIKNSVFQDAYDQYSKRIRHWSIQTIELSDKQFQKLSPKNELWIALDERGASWSSAEFCHQITQWVEGPMVPCFVIGPSDGLPRSVRESCRVVLSFSGMTWPHLMARVLLIEQIYRAQQRTLNHPYSFV